MGDASSNAGFGLDRAFLSYTNKVGTTLTIGKSGANWWQQNEIFIDEDISPEGIGLLQSFGNLTFRAAHYIFLEQNWSGIFDDDNIILGQVVYNNSFDELTTTLAGGYSILKYKEDDIDDRMVLTTYIQGKYKNFTLGIDYLKSSEESKNSGMVFMFKKNVGVVNMGVWYYDIGEFSTLNGNLSQDNFPISVGFTGYRIQGEVKLSDNIWMDLRYYGQKLDNADKTEITRIQANINAKF
jgi:hypothetical protein